MWSSHSHVERRPHPLRGAARAYPQDGDQERLQALLARRQPKLGVALWLPKTDSCLRSTMLCYYSCLFKAQSGAKMKDLIVDNTILTSVARCKTQAAMRHVLGLTTGHEGIELLAGQAVHEVLAWWASGQPDEAALTRLRHYNPEVPPDDDRLSPCNVRRITAFWLRQHPLASWQFAVKPEEVEVPMIHSLGVIRNRQVTMVALLDLIGKRKTGGRWSVDHKTTKQINKWFEDDQETSSQFTGQLWLAKQKEILLSGIYVNALEYPRLPSSDRKCSTHGGVLYKECALKHASSRLIPIIRTPAEVDAWEITARRLVKQYIYLLETVETVADVRGVPMDGRFTRSCARCEFREWCEMGRPPGSAKTFKREKWNPLEHAQKHTQTMRKEATT